MLATFTLLVGLYGACILGVFLLRAVNPPTTTVQIQRHVEAMWAHRPYHKQYKFVPLRQISPNLQHAIVAAEDGRFFQHHGFDWVEMRKVLDQDMQTQKLGRGGSTITQQLVKNLFLTTERSFLRKGAEFAVVPIMEACLPKKRILELYLNVIEWGPGIYGAEAAAEKYYRVHASEVSRDQSARLAAIVPSPLHRNPAHMNDYSAVILERMSKSGW
ncbi:MAG TPA: monofunctional biosynthetic peptidoglycan transglycosylase [Bryobacteraceae bacterium]|nr:monofunctional biosynthetic peptidoglycan transglycosylase [Bryobacteraceae bacterium]